MPRETKTETIDGLKVTVTQHPAVAAMLMWSRFVPVLTPFLRSLPAGFKFSEIENVSVATLAPAIAAAAEKLPPSKLEELLLELFKYTEVVFKRGSKPVNVSFADRDMIDEALGANVGALMKIARFALKANFASFGIGAPHSTSGAPEQEAAAE